MTRGNQASRERRFTEIDETLEQDDSEGGETPIRGMDNDNHVKRSAPLQRQWTSSEDSSRPYNREIKTGFLREQDNTEDTETESPGIRSKSRRSEGHARGKSSHSDTHPSEERMASKIASDKRKKHSKRIERRRFRERPRTADYDRSNVDSSIRHYSTEDNVTDKSRRKKNASRENDEVPITEILRKAQENVRTKYEEPVPFPELTTDTIYIQGRNGFSAVKIGGLRRALGNDTTHVTKRGIRGEEDDGLSENCAHTLIRVAITAQKFWKCIGLVYQGLLGGMALLHFIMIHAFFNISMEFMLRYSIFSEIYTNLFSFLIALCVISVFDRFDLARLDVDHLREIYTDHAKTAIAVPLYLVTFGLHQASSKVDDQLALMHYYDINETIWSNNTMLEPFLDELASWQRITISKDILAVIAWLFVSLGTRDNMLLMYLESMEKYASNVESLR